jgi:outer membrane lipoprotein-sorting protein
MRLGAAQRNHAGLLRAFEVFDRNHDQQREQLMAALPPELAGFQGDRLVRGWRRLGDSIMPVSWKASGRATAAVLGAAACIALVAVLFVSGGKQGAFAAAIEQFHKAQTIVCRVASPMPVAVGGLKIQQTGKLYVSAEHGARFENYGNGFLTNIHYTPFEGPTIVVNPPARNYMVIDVQAAGDDARASARPDEFIRALQELSAEADRELGLRTIEGVEAEGYEISGRTLGLGSLPDARSELWVDSSTFLPVRYVTEVPGFEPGTTFTLVYDRFEWDTSLDPQLFQPDIPDDYTRLDARMPVPDEATLITGLAKFAELTGKYPTRMDMTGVVGELMSGIASHTADGEELDREALVQESLEIGAGCAFYQKLANDGRDPEYFGATVQPGDAGVVLLRWKLDEDQWRVVYGDLATETVPVD